LCIHPRRKLTTDDILHDHLLSRFQELGQPSEAAASAVTKTKLSTDDVKQLVQTQDWSTLAKSSSVFGSANVRTFAVSLAMLEQRTGLTARSLGLDDGTGAQGGADLDDLKWATVIVALGSAALGVAALALLPPNIGATACYLIALIPVLFLGIGSTAPGLILNVIGSIKGGGGVGEKGNAQSVSQRERRVRHEAAHLCCGYWCGLPVQSYSVDENGAQVEFGSTSPPPYSPTQVAALAVTGLAGLVAEALQWSNAQGATQDLLLVDSIFRKGQDFYGAAAQQDLTRWAAFTAVQLLRQYEAKYERVVQAMNNQAPLADCVAILEE